MKTRTPLGITLAAAAALAGCNQESHTIGGGAEDADAIVTPPVALPPSISVSKIYRCADNRVVYIDWLSDNKSANVRTKQDGLPIQVTSAEAGQPMTAAGGYSLNGTSGASSVRIAVPDHPSQSCKA